MNVEELGEALEERGLTLTVHGDTGWIVWVHAYDDPALGAFMGEDPTLEEAILKALRQWDGMDESKVKDGAH